MLPRSANENISYCGSGYSQVPAEAYLCIISRTIKVSDFLHDFWIKLRLVVFNSAYVSLSSFRKLVSAIIEIGPYKEMFRVAAGWVITSMADKHTFWNFPVRKNPSVSVRKIGFSFMLHLAVPLWIFVRGPLPAGIWSSRRIHILPKTGANHGFFTSNNRARPYEFPVVGNTSTAREILFATIFNRTFSHKTTVQNRRTLIKDKIS